MRKAAIRGIRRTVLALVGLVSLASASAEDSQSISISASGTPGYATKIAVPPGIAGMAPQLALVYTGNNVNGPVGVGWTLQGVSTITRCPANRQIDGVARAVTYSPNDKLCLDGQRLIQTDATGVVTNDSVVNPNLNNPFQTNDSLGGPSGSAVHEYRTEKDIYSRIRAYGAAGGDPANGPAYFKVWTKSGQIFEYGLNTSMASGAAISATGKGVVSTWAVSRISDTVGNYIDFRYTQRDAALGSGSDANGPAAGREWNLSEVRYTGHGGQEPQNRVLFEYSDRPAGDAAPGDRAEAYHQGSKVINLSRLKAIRTFVNWPASAESRPNTAAKVKTYTIQYENGPRSGRSRVVSITECGGENENVCLPAPSFAYGDPQGQDPSRGISYTGSETFKNSALSSATLRDPSGKYGVLAGSFLGSGRIDLIRWSDNPAENELYQSAGGGNFVKVANGSGTGLFNLTNDNLGKSDGCYVSEVADFNGDGASDILRTVKNDARCSGKNVLYMSNGDGSFTSRDMPANIDLSRKVSVLEFVNCTADIPCQPNQNTLFRKQPANNYYLIDLNNDGLLDIVSAHHPGYEATPTEPREDTLCAAQLCTQVYIQQPDGTFVERTETNVQSKLLYSDPQPVLVSPYGKHLVADINGDGLSDISVHSGNWLSRGDGDFDYTSGSLTNQCSNFIDFNGDGKAECLYPAAGDPARNVLTMSDGVNAPRSINNFNLKDQGNVLLELIPGTSAYKTDSLPLDINGDGLTDIVRFGDDPAMNTLFLSNGDGTFRTGSLGLNGANDKLRTSDGTNDFIVGDFSGHGNVEFLRISTNLGNTLYVRQDSNPPDQLRSVTGATGLKTELTWMTLTYPFIGNGDQRFYSDFGTSAGAKYPYRDVAVPMPVVARIDADTGVRGQRLTTDYFYAGLKASYNGLGILGFREVRQQTPTSNGKYLTVLNEYLQDGYNTGLALLTRTWIGDLWGNPADVVSETWNIYCDRTASQEAQANAYSTTSCVPGSHVRRPYLYATYELGWEKGTALPMVETVNEYNDDGDTTKIVNSIRGNALEMSQHFVKTTVNTYFPGNKAEDQWIIGRLQRATVTAENTSESLATTAGMGVQSRKSARVAATTLPPPFTQQGPGVVGVVYARDVVASATARTGTADSIDKLAVSPGSAPFATATKGAKFAVSIEPSAIALYSKTAGDLGDFLTAKVVGGVPPYTYDWTRVEGNRFEIYSAKLVRSKIWATLALGEVITETWKVTVHDATQAEVSATAPVTLGVPSGPPSVKITPSPLKVDGNDAGDVSGMVTAAATGGAPPYTFKWTRTSGTKTTVSDPTIASPVVKGNLTAGATLTETWRATVVDSFNKSSSADVNVTFTVPAALAVPLAATKAVTVDTSGTGTAVLSVAPTGGRPPYTYAWTLTSGGSSTISDPAVGNPSVSATVELGHSTVETWTVEVTDSVGHKKSASTAITFTYPAPMLSWVKTPASITVQANDPGPSSGQFDVNPTGGVPPYSYSWSHSTGTRTSLSSLNEQNPTVSATLNAGDSFSEQWKVIVTDSVGKTLSSSVNAAFTAPATLVVPLAATWSSTANSTTGIATMSYSIKPTGGRTPYTYAWTRTAGSRSTISDATVSNPVVSLQMSVGESFPETWQVTVTDAAGHSTSASATITFSYPAPAMSWSPTLSSITVTGNDPGLASGQFKATPAGDVPPYTYAWTRTAGSKSSLSDASIANPQVSAVLVAGDSFSETYKVTAIDMKGTALSGSMSVTFKAPATLTATLAATKSLTAAASTGVATGTLSATVAGGIAPYTYLWERTGGSRSTLSSEQVASPVFSITLALGENVTETWRVTVTDAVGHTASASTAITSNYPPAAMGLTFTPANPRNDAPDAGLVSVTVTGNPTGGIPPYTYAWTRYSGSSTTVANPSAASAVVSATLAAGGSVSETWKLMVTDTRGQTYSSNVSIAMTAPAALTVPLASTKAASSATASTNGVSSASMSITPTGGRTPYTYAWARVSGSRSTASSQVVSNPTITAVLGLGETLVERWRLTVSDSVGHSTAAETDIAFAYPAPAMTQSSANVTVVANDPGVVSGTTTGSTAGGVPPYSYAWAHVSGTRTTVDNPTIRLPNFSATLNAGESVTEQWKLTTTDSAGKTIATTVQVALSVRTALTVAPKATATSVTIPASTGTGSTTLSTNATGGLAPYTYLWTRIAGTGSSVSNAAIQNPTLSATLSPGQSSAEVWQVTVQDAAGHVAGGSVTVNFTYPLPPLTLTATPTSLTATGSAAGMVSGQVSVGVSGGAAPYTYTWSRATGTVSQLLGGGDASATIGAVLSGPGIVSESWKVEVKDSRGSVASKTIPTTFRVNGLAFNCPVTNVANFACSITNYTTATESSIAIQASNNNNVRFSPLYLKNCAAGASCGSITVSVIGTGRQTGTLTAYGAGGTPSISYDVTIK